jgi:hypothetical protein
MGGNVKYSPGVFSEVERIHSVGSSESPVTPRRIR